MFLDVINTILRLFGMRATRIVKPPIVPFVYLKGTEILNEGAKEAAKPIKQYNSFTEIRPQKVVAEAATQQAQYAEYVTSAEAGYASDTSQTNLPEIYRARGGK